jgi:hypothetical protein
MATGWAWQVIRPDGTMECSMLRFLTQKDCVVDATLHGYVAWIPAAERRGSK